MDRKRPWLETKPDKPPEVEIGDIVRIHYVQYVIRKLEFVDDGISAYWGPFSDKSTIIGNETTDNLFLAPDGIWEIRSD